ncbi:type III secretion system (T3SS) SseB-like protein [Palleronia aestuarii]|uniref:Type III secretion system (T3SS) SseB-like protein n=1 Tax=Palleronia aestuarii TaxID=568105 RepID=A0A2W7NES1_9RHOB|nr:SseB family protein [Palleronia aestuarii]PZX18420.1 type III secretion system (T3SS) SseB-like protein [Palleronia aestuarii]
MTPLDRAHDAMMADEADDAARLAFYERVADAELYLLLDGEPSGDVLDPRIFETSQGAFALVFDLADRLAEFAGGPAPYAALSGRLLVGMVAGQGCGIALNPGVAPSSILLPADAVGWIAATLAEEATEHEARPVELTFPAGLPERLLPALDAKLGLASGRARFAYLAAVRYADGTNGHMLAFVGATPGAERALAGAVREALVFSGLEAGQIDVAFFDPSDAIAARLAKVGLRIDLPVPEEPGPRDAPGSDPDRPPRLR